MTPKAFIDQALKHLPALLRVGQRLTRSRAEAEDLSQDTLIRALAHRTSLRDADRMLPWLLAIQRTVHLNGQRGLRQRFEVLDGGLSAQEQPPQGDLRQEVATQGVDDELLAALNSLPAEWREVLWLREVEELMYEEIAAVQGCPIGTVRSRLARAREALAHALEVQEVPRARLQR